MFCGCRIDLGRRETSSRRVGLDGDDVRYIRRIEDAREGNTHGAFMGKKSQSRFRRSAAPSLSLSPSLSPALGSEEGDPERYVEVA